MNCFYSGLVDIPGTVLTVYLLRKVGGRICFTIFMVSSSVFIICTAIFDPSKHQIKNLLVVNLV